MMKRKLALTLLIFTVLTMTLTAAFAAESQTPTIQPMYTYVSSAKVNLTISQNTASCYGMVRLDGASYADATLTLKRKSGNNWVTVSIWNTTGKNVKSVSISKTRTLSVQGSYKLVLSARIKDSSGAVLESISKTSAIKTY